MLTLPIKKKWYDMILSGEKKEEYREIKPYYTVRFTGVGLLFPGLNEPTEEIRNIIFRNGYGRNAPQAMASVRLRIGEGNAEWGAVPGVQYYVLEILEVHELDPDSWLM